MEKLDVLNLPVKNFINAGQLGSTLDAFPKELQIKIFQYFSLEDLASVSLVCKK